MTTPPTPARLSRRSLLRGASALGGALILGARAHASLDWPNKPIRIVVPFAAGGGTDIMARSLAESLAKRLGQAVVVENKPGASGIMGTTDVVRAPADGYTLLVSLSTSMLINQFLYTNLPYKPQQDLTLLSQMTAGPLVLLTHPSIPANTMPELLDYVKANPGKLSYGSWGVGSYPHLGGAYMSKTMGADMVHIAYRGEAPIVQDLIGGRISLYFGSGLQKPFIESGKIKAIGVTGTSRLDILPDVPTIAEQGVDDDAYAVIGWIGIGAPAGLPQGIVEQLSAHLRHVAQDPALIQRAATVGLPLILSSPEEFRQSYARDMPVWKRLVEIADARLD